jgi:site-specific DNA recombinase
MSEKSKYRCSVYTRKSTDEGLEQDFNSLDAQRESCEAYIVSQASLGWRMVSTHYDDGGLSGGNMDRPALQKLLDDIRKSKIDVVVVYKIDRLTRSLMDFAKMVEVFDAQNVSFVSVTQQFNTTTSMGRLTLNVLLSFAQFEREVTAERIRDKIAASKKKGMWMGGLPPLGFDVEDKQLIINEAEAETVRQLYDLYLEFKSVRRLKENADQLSIVTKHRSIDNKRLRGGKPFSRGNLYQLLSNPIYIGRIKHYNETYPGRHQPIIDQDTWGSVQNLMATNTVERKAAINAIYPSLLNGLVFDETGDRLSPTHAVKNKKRHRYYISHRLIQARRKNQDGWRLPAKELEGAVLNCLIRFLNNQQQLLDELHLSDQTINLQQVALRQANRMVRHLTNKTPSQQRKLVHSIIEKVCITPGKLELALNASNLAKTLFGGKPDADKMNLPCTDIRIEASFLTKKRGVEAKLVITNENKTQPDIGLITLIAKAHRWLYQLTKGKVQSIEKLAKIDNEDRAEVSRILPLAFLAPDMIETILTGSHPVDLTASRLKRLGQLPIGWADQREVLRFVTQI